MVGKRFFLIAGGTVGGLGVVLSITPPQFGSATGLSLGSGTLLSSGTTPTPVATPSIPVAGTPTPLAGTPTPAAPAKTPPVKKRRSKKKVSAPTPANKPTPANTPAPASVSGTFTGAAAGTIYGPVQVQITIVNSVITKAVALTYPTATFRDQQINQQAIPYLIQETLTAQSANIQGVGGASFTSTGWATSLQSALVKAGL